MPYAINAAAPRKQLYWNISRPQEAVKFDGGIPETWGGTSTQGLPVTEIPHYEFPLCVYLHPLLPTQTVVHRNANHEIVEQEEVPLEHLVKVICCDEHKNGGPKDCAACNQLLEAALMEGWRREPHITRPAVDERRALYGPRKKKDIAK